MKSGERVGAFEILGPLGAGGMGEVYRARDPKLGREVALKILPPHLSGDSERLARFQREARVLASLNHPGIGTIYGVEESSYGTLLILELVPGETLAERIGRGALPLAEALQIGRQIADAVAFAHASGVVHRDLKPANVKCTPQGTVKVLDFGLAKALGPDREAPGSADPTVTPITTQDGAILGTPAYMSPEQARAKEIDRRTDVWSLGCILFEMLTGRRAFQRATLTDTLVAVLGEEPDWSLLPSTTPAPVRSLLRRCLQRDRDRRYHDMADVRIEIDEALTPSALARAPELEPARRANALQPFEWVCAGVIVLAALTHAIFLYRLVPTLAAMAAGFAVELSWQLRAYIGLSNLSLWIVPILFAAWGLWRLTGRRVEPAVRSALLIVLATLSVVTIVSGLYLIATDGMVQAMRLVVGSPSIDRDLIVLHGAAGDPARVIAILDPTGNRDDFATAVTAHSPTEAFQLAEAYRAKGDLVAARRLYTRAQEAAVKFDEVISEQMQNRQDRWRGAFGQIVTEWAPSTADVRLLPDLIRSVAQQRLDELDKAATPR
jgi:hypothetical protein